MKKGTLVGIFMSNFTCVFYVCTCEVREMLGCQASLSIAFHLVFETNSLTEPHLPVLIIMDWNFTSKPPQLNIFFITVALVMCLFTAIKALTKTPSKIKFLETRKIAQQLQVFVLLPAPTWWLSINFKSNSMGSNAGIRYTHDTHASKNIHTHIIK